MTRTQNDFSFWRSFGQLKIHNILNWQNLAAVVVGVSAGILAKLFLMPLDRVGIADDMKSLAGGLVGVVFSGFALVIGLMSDRYALWLARTTDGAIGFLRPFFVSVGMQVGALLLIVTYRATARFIPVGLEQVFFGFLVMVFLVALLDIVALAKTVFAHGVTRVDSAELDELERDVRGQNGDGDSK